MDELDCSDFRAKYFPVLPRLPISFTPGGDSVPQVGDVVACQVTANWTVQRSPVSLAVLSSASTPSSKAFKKKGRINRLKFRVRAPASSEFVSADCLQCYGVATIDFVELVDLSYEDSSHSADALGQYFYCQAQELMPSDENSRELAQIGDEVEFWVVPSAGPSAFGAKLLPKVSSREHGVSS